MLLPLANSMSECLHNFSLSGCQQHICLTRILNSWKMRWWMTPELLQLTYSLDIVAFCFTHDASDASISDWTQTLNLRKMRQAFWHHSIIGFSCWIFSPLLSLPVSASIAAFKLSTLGWWGQCSAIIVPLLANSMNECFNNFSLTGCQQHMLESNPQQLKDEVAIDLCATSADLFIADFCISSHSCC